jgi:glucokinase
LTTAIPRFAKAPVLCDLGGASIRFCLGQTEESDPALDIEARDTLYRAWTPTRDFRRDRPFHEALGLYLAKPGIGGSSGRELRLSLPILPEKLRDNKELTFAHLPKSWRFNISGIAREFDFSRILVCNDAVAAFYGTYKCIALAREGENINSALSLVQRGHSQDSSTILLLSPGTGLGGVYAHRNKSRYYEPEIVPLETIIPNWRDANLRECLNYFRDNPDTHSKSIRIIDLNMSFREGQDAYAGFFASGAGLIRLKRYINRGAGEKLRDISLPVEIALQAAQLKGDSNEAAGRMFCSALAQTIFEVTLGATPERPIGMIYLTGGVVNALGAIGLLRLGFCSQLQTFDERLTKIPISIVKHPAPALVGLGRFKLAPR